MNNKVKKRKSHRCYCGIGYGQYHAHNPNRVKKRKHRHRFVVHSYELNDDWSVMTTIYKPCCCGKVRPLNNKVEGR